jgi:hypothetical protein
MIEKSVWRTSGQEDESEERNRASFPRWGKLRVISYHFTELVLEIVEMGKILEQEERMARWYLTRIKNRTLAFCEKSFKIECNYEKTMFIFRLLRLAPSCSRFSPR